MKSILLFIFFSLLLSGYAISGSDKKVSSIELQENLERFTGNFIERMAEIFQSQKSDMQREELAYASNALDIATGPDPKTNLLDMMAFITLTRQNIEERNQNKKLRIAFWKSEQEIWDLAGKITSEKQRLAYMAVIQDWKKKNPDIRRSGLTRIPGIYRISHPKGEDQKEVSGLLGHMDSVVESTDEVILMSQRAMFLAQRVPFLLRFHARLGAREVASETIDELTRNHKLTNEMERMNPFVENLTILATRSQDSLRRMENIFRETTPEKLKEMEKIVSGANEATEKILAMNPKKAESSFRYLRKQMERLIYIGLGAALLLICAWWIGYVWARRRLEHRHA